MINWVEEFVTFSDLRRGILQRDEITTLETRAEAGPELRLDAGYGDRPSVGRLVDAVARIATRESAAPARFAVAHRQELRRLDMEPVQDTMSHRNVERLGSAGALAIEERGDDA